MAWTNPPTFADNNILTATQLNILSDDIAYLYGLLQAANPTLTTLYANQSLTSTNNAWKIRYRHNYLHYRANVAVGQNDAFKLYVNGTLTSLNDTTARSAGYVYTGYVDLTSLSLTPGTVYNCYFTSTLNGISAVLVEYLIQAETTSL